MFYKSLFVIGAVLFAPMSAQAYNGPTKTVITSTANQHGSWQLNPAACPDLVEDRRDARVTTSRRDAREDRRDSRTVTCPASAWSFVLNRGAVRTHYTQPYTGPRQVIVNGVGQYKVKPVVKRAPVKQSSPITLVIR
ncbi:hypothetical protein DES40_1417 [Litorimonas taeanensis]|uniref:Uncharacterized protein n=1 Tax=Litorimonas taeanensis TaxID=568099 RepID=A0A420WM66_9PROT|nr:hypothetical protein [Litorimonas taeanensis]RKQ72080.1 hypothetical protein DES40_1417 [Litorimonas taeanensis]